MRSGAVRRSSKRVPRSAVAGSAPSCIPLVVVSSSRTRAEHDCHSGCWLTVKGFKPSGIASLKAPGGGNRRSHGPCAGCQVPFFWHPAELGGRLGAELRRGLRGGGARDRCPVRWVDVGQVATSPGHYGSSAPGESDGGRK